MSGFLPPPLHRLSRASFAGPSADAGHYLGPGFDKSIIHWAKSRDWCRAMTQMLRRLAFVGLDGSQDLHGAAGLLARRYRRLRGAMHLDIDLGLDRAAAEQPNAALGAANHARLDQRFRVDGVLDIDQLGIDRLLQPVEIDLGVFDPEHVVEAALGQAAMQRHLAAFETLDAHAGTRRLALAAAACLLALA